MNHEYTSQEPVCTEGLARKIGKRIHGMIHPDAEIRRERNQRTIAKALKDGRYLHIHSAEGAPGLPSNHLADLRPAESGDYSEQKNY